MDMELLRMELPYFLDPIPRPSTPPAKTSSIPLLLLGAALRARRASRQARRRQQPRARGSGGGASLSRAKRRRRHRLHPRRRARAAQEEERRQGVDRQAGPADGTAQALPEGGAHIKAYIETRSVRGRECVARARWEGGGGGDGGVGEQG
eukprot:1927235-Pleurochrysis_carterae.AAC.1